MKFNHPHFLVVGPAKTGTTWLYEQLKHVEGFAMPPTKEVCFFNEVNFAHTIDPGSGFLKKYEDQGHLVSVSRLKEAKKKFIQRRILNQHYAYEQKQFLWGLFYRYFPRNTGQLSWYFYSLLFDHRKDTVTGDISPLYFPVKEEVIEIIAKRFPYLKIVIIIREPVERAWSNIRMNYYSELAVPGFSIKEYLAKPNPGSDYQYAITNWEKHFGPHRMQYLFYDDLANQPRKFLQQFLNFVKPGTTVNTVFEEKVGKGVEKEMDKQLRMELLKRNLPQYHFLAQKFGTGSYPETWLKNALKEIDGQE